MKEIFYNQHFSSRTKEQQTIINIMVDHFPTSGYPRHLLLFDNIIAISSSLGIMHIGYQHEDYKFGSKQKSNRIGFYTKSDHQLVFQQDLKYAVNAILKVDHRILVGTGVWGQPSKGELFEYNLKTNTFNTCTGESKVVSFLVDKDDYVEVYSFCQTGAYEGENRVYKLDKHAAFKLDYNKNVYDRLISDEEYEEMCNQKINTVTIDNLNHILNT